MRISNKIEYGSRQTSKRRITFQFSFHAHYIIGIYLKTAIRAQYAEIAADICGISSVSLWIGEKYQNRHYAAALDGASLAKCWNGLRRCIPFGFPVLVWGNDKRGTKTVCALTGLGIWDRLTVATMPGGFGGNRWLKREANRQR